MPNRIHVAFVAGLLATAAFGIAQSTTQIKIVPVKPTSAASGQQMFATYCVACHGADGRGNGPAAAALKDRPTNLTTLAQANGGKFPQAHVESVLRFGVETPAHGSVGMPTWGPALRSLNVGAQSESMEELQRISNLANYLKSIQQ